VVSSTRGGGDEEEWEGGAGEIVSTVEKVEEKSVERGDVEE
jgi:hypothetical protein